MKVRVRCRVPRREGRQKLSRDAVLPALNLCQEGCPVDAVSGLDLLSKICGQCCAGDVREDFCLVAVYVGFRLQDVSQDLDLMKPALAGS